MQYSVNRKKTLKNIDVYIDKRRGYSCVIVPTLDKPDKVRGNQELRLLPPIELA